MTLSQFRAVIRGYEDHLFDLECLTVHAGHWAGYYYNSKRPKSLSVIIKDLCSKYAQSKSKSVNKSAVVEKPDVDVDEFLRREERFNKCRKSRR